LIAGNNTKKYRKGNIISLDYVENLGELLYVADFAIVPIISGEGQRVKISDYIFSALPFISTKIGIKGIDFLDDGKDFILCDKVDKKFIDKIYLLYKNKTLREKLHRNLKRKSKKLSQEEMEKRLVRLYLKIKEIKDKCK
ncbi:MAG: glycosyltransferase family 4 protein, partial [Promethearchaeota archaeon]